jgi:hypothetical protein
MGKNQAYKAMQRSRLGSSSAGPEEIEDGMVCTFSYCSLNSHVQFPLFYYPFSSSFMFFFFVLIFVALA